MSDNTLGNQARLEFLNNHVIKVMVVSNRIRHSFCKILEDVGFNTGYLIMKVLEKEQFLSVVGDGKRVKNALENVKTLKFTIIEVQKENNLIIECPESLQGLHNAIAGMLFDLFGASDQLHGFFGNPLSDQAFGWLTNGWDYLEGFKSRYETIREILRDLLDENAYKRYFSSLSSK